MNVVDPITPRPLVSVIITTKNRCHLVGAAIDSVRAVDATTFDVELIVVDDGSTDDTDAVLSERGIVPIRTGGVGMAGARNLGLAAATGDFVTVLDDDDCWLPNNIAPQLQLLLTHPEFGAAHAQCQITTADLEPVGAPFPTGPLPSGWIFEELLGYFPQVACILTRAEVARAVGPMDETVVADTDWDWILRIAKRYPIGRIEVPVMLFRQRAEFDDRMEWSRFPATVQLFRRHTRDLGWRKRIQLEPLQWKTRGQWSASFVGQAGIYWRARQRTDALRCVGYAIRCSPPHAMVNLLRFRARPTGES